jgi:hypothetical protein
LLSNTIGEALGPEERIDDRAEKNAMPGKIETAK